MKNILLLFTLLVCVLLMPGISTSQPADSESLPETSPEAEPASESESTALMTKEKGFPKLFYSELKDRVSAVYKQMEQYRFRIEAAKGGDPFYALIEISIVS